VQDLDRTGLYGQSAYSTDLGKRGKERMGFKVLARTLAASAAAALLVPVVVQAEPLLVGGYTGKGGQGIAVYDFDSRTGQIAARPQQVVPAINPSWLALARSPAPLRREREQRGPGRSGGACLGLSA
jgi:hypothetical protein